MARPRKAPALVTHWAEVHHVEWEGPPYGPMDGERAAKVSDGRRRVRAILDPKGARAIAKDLYEAARWCEAGLPSVSRCRVRP